MNFTIEQARTQTRLADQMICDTFPKYAECLVDAEFLTADRSRALGFAGGLPWYAPICAHLLADAEVGSFIEGLESSAVFVCREDGLGLVTDAGEMELPEQVEKTVTEIYRRILKSPGELNEKGELVLDLKSYPVGPHYPVNLLLGNREGYPMPLVSTPKSALDALGRGSFRGVGAKQVLATRYVLQLEEAGEPANRQFYLVENGKQIFYSADVRTNVKSAKCVHSQSRTVISYETECGLAIKRTIFILPQEDGMPGAVEAQRVEIENRSGKDRELKIVFTGMFGITDPSTLANDIVYANVVVESEIYYKNGKPAAMTVHHKPAELKGEKRFALLLADGACMDEFCTSLPDFLGTGTINAPELVAKLPNRYARKNAPFFAMGKRICVPADGKKTVDTFVGMMESEEAVEKPFDAALTLLMSKYEKPEALEAVLEGVVKFWDYYPTYIQPATGDANFDSYVGHNLPFQTLYQTYVSRAFAWTQKAYREIGFREIQDIYASMYYMNAMGKNSLIKELLTNWIRNVFRMGYANHNFVVEGKEPGVCSDDSLWLLQAVDRYTALTGDTDILLESFDVADKNEKAGKRTLAETFLNILLYSGKISVGKNGLPLLDHADWNDTLRLDRQVWNGPEKEAAYAKQLLESNKPYGSWFENTKSESVMNACLLKIAADAAARMAEEELEKLKKTGDLDREVAVSGLYAAAGENAKEPALAMKEERETAGRLLESLKNLAEEISADVAESMQKNAWKGDFFARCLINDGREGGYTYLGAGGDGLNLEEGKEGTYFLNSYSWALLAGVATEKQISIMLDQVEKHLKTDAGLKLCTLVDFDLLNISTGTALYFPGDRENGGVFKHAAMMATVASLQAAKTVKDEALSKRLADLAFFMIGRTLPYRTFENPFVLKGNPRFCTQYNNSETGENIGPMLSGTASWLSLAVYEAFGIHTGKDTLTFEPLLEPGKDALRYSLRLEDTTIEVEIAAADGKIRADSASVYEFDGARCEAVVARPRDGKHHIMRITL